MRKNGKYQEAMVEYENLKNIAPADKRWEKGYNSCLLADIWVKNPTRYEVEELKEINSKENDFCPSYSTDDYSSIVFTSCRQSEDEKDKEKEAKKSAVSGMPFTNLFESRFDRKGKWSNPTAIEDTVVNTEFDDGAATFSADKKIMYLTFCKIETGKQLGCRILAVKRKGTEWGRSRTAKNS
ncbi:MAG: hypothetical protein IPO21_06840 [Bacteroidales bacterium]|nr:hypothetical protein [Bacteroidales bacterium]